jgi:hypothetical protein
MPIIILNPYVDAVYDASNDGLYFKDFVKIKVMFQGIESMYRIATQAEVTEFLGSNFLTINAAYNVNKVKVANRKRIAMVMDTLSQLSRTQKRSLFDYMRQYCADVPLIGDTFEIVTEDHLKKVLYGIDQRYYTTHLGNERRIANSIQVI